MTERARSEFITALIALLLFSTLSLYLLWDVRAAFSDFDGWWEFFEPVRPGDDFVAATLDAEQISDWHVYYRSITVTTEARRMAGGRVDALYAPERLYLTWGTRAEDPTDYDHPGLRDVSLEGLSGQAVVWQDYDPALPDDIIAGFEADGRVVETEWNVARVQPDEPESSYVIHTDMDREWVYVVPLSLSPLEVE